MNIPFYVPPISLCTDNAAMIAAAGASMFNSGVRGNFDEWKTWNGTCFME